MLMFKMKNWRWGRGMEGLTLAYLQNVFSIRSTPHNLRNSELKLDPPKPRTDYCKRGFGYSRALLWNNLPAYLRKSDFLGRFEREIDQLYNNCQLGSHTAIF